MQGVAPVDVNPAAQDLQFPETALQAPGLQPGWQLKQALAPIGAHCPVTLQSAQPSHATQQYMCSARPDGMPIARGCDSLSLHSHCTACQSHLPKSQQQPIVGEYQVVPVVQLLTCAAAGGRVMREAEWARGRRRRRRRGRTRRPRRRRTRRRRRRRTRGRRARWARRRRPLPWWWWTLARRWRMLSWRRRTLVGLCVGLCVGLRVRPGMWLRMWSGMRFRVWFPVRLRMRLRVRLSVWFWVVWFRVRLRFGSSLRVASNVSAVQARSHLK